MQERGNTNAKFMGTASTPPTHPPPNPCRAVQERGNTNAKFWGASILEALGGERHWYQVALRQLSGMLVLVFARNKLKVWAWLALLLCGRLCVCVRERVVGGEGRAGQVCGWVDGLASVWLRLGSDEIK